MSLIHNGCLYHDPAAGKTAGGRFSPIRIFDIPSFIPFLKYPPPYRSLTPGPAVSLFMPDDRARTHILFSDSN
ncbi:MAG: hypothetical protein DSY89_07695 [Deltaproteobacteria bacterium]|nr:MAG: hypothetical protein DSY89_07695 [Deltaproteobacteria bacterium]